MLFVKLTDCHRGIAWVNIDRAIAIYPMEDSTGEVDTMISMEDECFRVKEKPEQILELAEAQLRARIPSMDSARQAVQDLVSKIAVHR